MSFNPIELWGKMTIVAQGVVVVLIIMSIYSLTVAFERFLYYRKARNQSVQYAKLVTNYLKQDKLQEAIDASAVRAVQQWKYKPATLNGRAVRVYLTVTVTFRLN